MRPDNNNLDAIAKAARQPLPKAQFGLIKGMMQGKNNQMNGLGKIIGGDPMGGISQMTGMKPEQLAGVAMKALPMLLKKGGSMKKKNC